MSFLDKNAPHFLQFLCLIDTRPIRRAKIEFFLVLQIENYFGFDCIYAHEMQFLQKPRRLLRVFFSNTLSNIYGIPNLKKLRGKCGSNI